ncbi:MAG: amino acid ABC transporter permease [Clostridia bacterium]
MPIFLQNIIDNLVNSFNITFIVDNRYLSFIEGLGNTLLITFFATMIGIFIGMLVAVSKIYTLQTGKLKILNKFTSLYLTVIRGTPVLVQLLIMYFIIFGSIKNPLPAAIITFGLNSGAYVSEIVRAGIMSIDKGQAEAGRSLGLSQGTTMRYIVMPQAIKNILPALGNEFIVLLKETSVAGAYLSIVDITKAGTMVQSRTYEAFFPLITVALIYLVLVLGISKLLKMLEMRFAKSDRR